MGLLRTGFFLTLHEGTLFQFIIFFIFTDDQAVHGQSPWGSEEGPQDQSPAHTRASPSSALSGEAARPESTGVPVTHESGPTAESRDHHLRVTGQ